MEQNSQQRRADLRSQIQESYGRIVYTYTTHLKCARQIRVWSETVKWLIVVLSAVSTCGLIGIIFDWNVRVMAIISVTITTLTLILSTYAKSANLDNQVAEHVSFATQLWNIRENYVSLLTDLDALEEIEVLEKRDSLQIETGTLYKNEPLTTTYAYKKAQKALKENEEQYFTKEELSKMLPKHLRG
jgi:hypothetical protein